ncbi:helix-hairpin-helix domain-containing protein [Streptococcus parauberis]|uniref:helix-hairpin-helix domain-containing protein n=2 Tax=Streptococcus parauberis TaxID=1348 RepID=UPI00020CC083|nr:helix-hairpin-helix domain-containing protein [Streptococcus parauberis]AEF25529.1 competence protein [Streptococcus parauberis KCTC 11537]UWM89991.1 helix-hairpin-helix domain-containing protein [Streptococcus parauberis]WEM63714.1 helix-hairpin-helix domain-containing protein [Streptococcus parauberis]GAJ61475.1 competence protein [Streptococcus parauberis]
MKEILTDIKQWYVNHYILGRIIVIIVCICLLFSLSLFVFGNSTADKQKEEDMIELRKEIIEVKEDKEQSQAESKSTDTSNQIMVDLKGAVKQEGVYKLPADSRVTDLVKMAGGLTQDADRQAINLAQKLSDASIIYIARLGENKSVLPSSTVQAADAPSDDEKININSATSDQLTKIPGIGEKRAHEIIEARDKMGGFKSLEDLTKISGIGKKTLEKMKDNLSIE